MPVETQLGKAVVEQVDHSTLVGIVKWIVTGLLGLISTLLGVIYHRMNRSVSDLFRWKDTVVDPALKEIPKTYVTRQDCNRRHDELIYEVRRTRLLLERHLGINGGREGP